MEPFVVRVRTALPRFRAVPGDRIYFDPQHPDILVLYRALHIRDTGAVLNALELGHVEVVSYPNYPSSVASSRRWRRSSRGSSESRVLPLHPPRERAP